MSEPEKIMNSNGTATILLVEDSAMEAEILRRALSSHGYPIIAAQNGAEGLAKTRELKPRLIISDINMPVMDGYELCHEVKRDPDLQNIPVILLSALSEPKDIIRAMDVGADGYLIKPCDEQVLHSRVRSLLSTPLKKEKEEIIRIEYKGERHDITADRHQIINLLLSIYENTLVQNRELVAIQTQLSLLNRHLEEKVIERTAALSAEIAERKKIESALRESDERFRAATETANDAIVYIDSSGTIYLWNKTAENMFGYTAEEAIGRGVHQLITPPEFHDQASQGLQTFSQTGDGPIIGKKREFRALHKGGFEFPVEISISALKTKKGLHAMGIIRDITERKRAEQAIEKFNAELLAANEELHRSMEKLQVASMQLITSEKLAGVGQLAAGVCHEVLNPINIISLHLQLLAKNKSGDPDVLEHLAKIKGEIQRVVKIVSALMTFSRKREPEVKRVQIEAEMDGVLFLIEKDFLLSNINVLRDYDNGLPEVAVDADQMRQVFLNLINNAKFAMKDAGGTFTIGIKKSERDGEGFLRIKFADTGKGIKKENMAKLFAPFFTTKPEGQGTGMGLAVCHTIVTNHKGLISVESEEGKGTTFLIDLPVNVDPVEP